MSFRFASQANNHDCPKKGFCSQIFQARLLTLSKILGADLYVNPDFATFSSQDTGAVLQLPWALIFFSVKMVAKYLLPRAGWKIHRATLQYHSLLASVWKAGCEEINEGHWFTLPVLRWGPEVYSRLWKERLDPLIIREGHWQTFKSQLLDFCMSQYSRWMHVHNLPLRSSQKRPVKDMVSAWQQTSS